MPRGRPKTPLEVTSGAREELESLARSRSLPAGLVNRAKIVLLCAEGVDNKTVADKLGTTRHTVGKWRERFRTQGLMGLYDERRPGKPRSIEDDEVMELIQKTLDTTPADGSTHWSCRSMAEATGLSKSTVHRVWKAFNLQPHRQKHFKLSTDPFFVEKVHDIVGLYICTRLSTRWSYASTRRLRPRPSNELSPSCPSASGTSKASPMAISVTGPRPSSLP